MPSKKDPEYEAFLKALGLRIRELRKAKGWSQRDMVVNHGYNDSQWRKYERGGGITLQSLVRIAELFELHLSSVLDGVGKSLPIVPSSRVQQPAPVKSTKKNK